MGFLRPSEEAGLFLGGGPDPAPALGRVVAASSPHTRPAITNERLQRNRAGDIVLQLKTPYQDGTTYIVMAPLEFLQRLAALVPRPRLHLIRFHGVLAVGIEM